MELDHLSEVLNYIGGERVPAVSGKTIDNHEPATGKTLGTLPASDAADVDKAVSSAKEALGSWGELSPEVRGFHLEKLAFLFWNIESLEFFESAHSNYHHEEWLFQAEVLNHSQ